MNYEEVSEIAMQIIANSGMSRSSSMEGIKAAKKGNFERAEELMIEADKYYLAAHEIQTNLIVEETASEDKIVLNLIMVHGQDHLTMALLSRDNAREIIDIYKRLEGK